MSHNIWRRWVSCLFNKNIFNKNIRTRLRKRRRLDLEPLEDRVVPATDTWTGLGTGTQAADWSNISNWSLGRAPVTGDTVVFGSTSPVTNRTIIDNLTTNPVLASVSISGTGYTLGNAGGSPLIVAGGINVASSLNTVYITQPVEFLPPPSTPQETVTVNNGSILDLSDPNVSGQVTAASNVTVSVTGTGTLEIASSNPNWLGALSLANTNGGGIVQVANATGLGSTTVTVNTNTQLQIASGTTGSFTITNSLLTNGSGIVNDGALLNVSGKNTWAGPVQMDSDTTFGTAAGTQLSITGTLSDNGAGHNLTKEGAGTLIFPNANTYRGTTTVNNGVLEIENPLSLGAGANALDSQSGSPQSETIVNYNPTANEIGTLEINFSSPDVSSTDPSALLLNPSLPYNAATNPLVGFQVFNDILVLNGPGFNNLGALYNASGDNEWDGSVILGSAPPALAYPTVDTAAGTQLTVSGIVSDPNQISMVYKTGTGELVFNDANTYRGGTDIEAGILDIDDSQALGTGTVYVVSGASLQLDVDQGFDGTSQRTHNRNLGFDSVTGSGPGQELDITGTSGTFTLSLGGRTSAVLNITSTTLTTDIENALNGPSGLLAEAGLSETVASVTQDGNIYRILFNENGPSYDVPLMTATATGGAQVTVNPIYGLTVSNSLVIDGPGTGTKPDTGALNSDSGINTYAGTIFNGYDAVTPPGVLLVADTAAIGVEADNRPGHPLANSDYLQWDNSLTVTGQISGGDLIKTGLGDLILPNANTYGDTTGIGNPTTDIQLGWITIKNNLSLGSNQSPSQANIPQTMEPYVEIDNGGALHLDPLPGTSLTLYDNFFLTGDGLTSPTYGLIEEAGAIENLYGDNTLAGILQLNGNAGIGVEQIPPTPTGFPPLLATSPPLTASQLTLTGYLWNYTNPVTGVVTPGGITKLGSRRLIIQGSGTYTGNVDIQAGVLLIQNNTALGAGNSTSPNPPTVTVENGAALEFGNTVNGENVGNGFTSENGGVQDGIEVWGEHLILNGSGDPTYDDSALTVLSGNAPVTGPTVQTVTVTGLMTGSYILSFDGVSTAPIAASATAAQVQAALTTLLNSLTGASAGGSVTVAQSGNVYTITFGGSLINTALLLSQVLTPFTDTFAAVNTTEIGTTSTMLSPVNDPIVATDSIWRGPVTLGNDTTITTDTNSTLPSSESASRLILAGTVSDLYNPANPSSPPPSDLTILGGGEVDLNGANTYSGTTYIQQGVVSIDNPQALGTSGISEVQTVTLTNPTANSTQFVLTFQGYAGINSPLTDSEMTSAITYTGNVTTDEHNITTALDGLSTIGGGTDTNGSVSVVETIASGKVTITITFGGSLTGFPQDLLGATVTNGTGTITTARVQAGAGGTVVENGASLQVAGSFTVAGEPLILEGNGSTQDIQTVTVSSGSTGTFTLSFTGPDSTGTEVTNNSAPLNVDSPTLATDIQTALDSMSNIGGVGGSVVVTETSSGVFTIAFGGTLSGKDVSSTAVTTAPALSLTVNGGNVVGGTVTTQTTQAGAPTIAGVPTQWFEVGPAPTDNGQTAQNQPVSGAVTAEAVDPRDPTVLYVGTAGGGVWKSIDDGNSWQPIFDAVPEIQTLTVSAGASGLFTLSFTGANSDGDIITDQTTQLNAASTTLASDIQAALDALSNIGGVGGQVTVSESGGTYMITFNGTLAGASLNSASVPMTVNNISLSGTVTAQEFEAGLDPIFSMYVGAITIDPENSNIIYVGTGQADTGSGTVQNADPNNAFYGTGVYESTDGGLTWSLLVDNSSSPNQTNPATGTTLIDPFMGMGVTGIAVDPATGSSANPTIYVSDGTVGGTGVGLGVPNGNNGEADVFQGTVQPGGTGQLAGVWRYTSVNGVTQWFNTTDVTTGSRQTLDGKQNAPPNKPGPDDDFRIDFPEETDPNVVWTDVQVIDTGIGNDGGEDGTGGSPVPVVYAALGSPGQWGGEGFSPDTPLDGGSAVYGVNAVYRGYLADTNSPVWYIGDPGKPADQVETITFTDPSGFNLNFNLTFNGAITPNTLYNPNVNMSGTLTGILDGLSTIGGIGGSVTVGLSSQSATVSVYTVTFGGALSDVPLPLIGYDTVNGLSIDVEITTPGGGVDTETGGEFPTYYVDSTLNGDIKLSVVAPPPGPDDSIEFTTVYASAPNSQTGDLLNIYVTTTGGLSWGTVSTLPPEYMNGQGNYANNILAVSASTVYVGGDASDLEDPTNMFFMTNNGGTTWTNITTATSGNTAHNAVHAIVADGNNVVVGTDGGIWQLNVTTLAVAPFTTTVTWNDLNSNLATAEVNGVDAAQSNPNEMVVGTEGNGLAYFNGLLSWIESDENGAAGSGPSGGLVYIDPDNTNIVYAVLNNPPPDALTSNFLESTNGGLTWSPVSGLPENFDTQDYPYFTFLMDPLNPNRLLVGGPDGLQESLNGGASWLTLLSPVNITSIAVAGYQGTFVSDPSFPDVSNLGANVDDSNTIYASNGNTLYVTKDLGLRWVTRTPPISGTIESITVNPANRDNVFVVTQGTPNEGLNQIWESTDAGISWNLIGGAGSAITGLNDMPLWQLAIDPRTGNLYIGTDNGVYELTNAAPITPQGPAAVPTAGTVAWERFGTGMPNVSVRILELNLSTNTLLAGTYGRGVYQLYLDASETTTSPAIAGVVGLSGASFWAGPVILVGDTVTNDVTVGADGTQGIPDGITAASINFVGPISDLTQGSNPTLNKDGDGDVIFSGDNTYGGLTTVGQGNLIAENLDALGGNTNGTTVIAGASLGLLANLDAEPVTLNGNGISFDNHYLGALRNISGLNTFTGNVTVNLPAPEAPQSVTIEADSGSVLTMDGSISGGGLGFTLVKEGTGTVAFDNSTPNTYVGITGIYQGALQAETSTAFSTGTVEVLDGAQVQLQTPSGSPPISVDNTLLLSGTGIDGTGALLDTGGDNTWSGNITLEILPGFSPFTLTPGTVSIGADAGDTLTISGVIDEESSSAPNIPGGILPMGLLKVGAGTVALSGANTYTGSTEVSQGFLDVQNSAALGDRTTATGLETIEQIVTLSNTGANGLGTGEFTLSFDGKTATASKLNFGASSSAVQDVLEGAGGGGGLFASAGFVNATVQVYRTPIQTTTENGPGLISPPTDVTGWVYTLVFGGSLTQTPIQVEANGSGGTLASTSVVAAGGIDVVVDHAVTGTGELELDNSALSPGTGLVVSNYTLTLNGNGPNGNGALYNLVGDNTWSGPVILEANDSLVPPSVTLVGVGVSAATPSSPSSLTLTDVQSISIQVGSLVPEQPELNKVGPGTLIFPNLPTNASYTAQTDFATGDIQSNLGTTVVSAGSVQVDATGFGPILLDGGTVSGNGNVTSINYASTAASGTIDPGDNYKLGQGNDETSGLFTSTGNVTLNSNDTVYVNLGLPTNPSLPPTNNNNDILDVTGTLDLAGAMLNGLVDPHVLIGDSYTIINAGSVVGTFVNQGPIITNPAESDALYATVSYIDGVKFEVDYISTANNGIVNRVDVIRELAQVTMTVTPSSTSPVYGQDEQFIATLTAETGAPNPTGTVVFTVVGPSGSTNYDVTLPTNPATGVATLDLPTVLDGPPMEGGSGYTVTASYDGYDADGNYTFTPLSDIAMSPPSVTVQPANTTTTLSVTYPLPEVYGETFTLTASVSTAVTSPVVNTLAPAGTVSFYNGAEIPADLLATVALTSPPPGTTTATATLVSTQLASLVGEGNHTIYAVYNPSSSPDNYVTSFGDAGLSIHPDGTTVTVTTPPISPAPVYGQAGITFTATVAPVSPGSGDPTGVVIFKDGTTVLGQGTLSTTGGVTTATYTTTSGQLLEGSTTITATYGGDSNFTGNVGSMTEVVAQAGTTTTVSSSAPTGVPYGSTVTFTATVAPVSPGGGNPTGAVTFMDGTTPIGVGYLSTTNGVTTATYTTLAFQLPVGSGVTLPTSQTITAVYAGDNNFTGSTSPGLSQPITLASSTTTVNTSGPSVYGQPVTFTATVAPTVLGGTIPTGTVTFYVIENGNPVQLGSGTLGTTGGVTTASYTTTVGKLPVGVNETITAVYNGDSHYATSTGTTSQTVSQANTETILTSSGPVLPNQSVTFTAQVIALSPGAGNATGGVNFMLGSTLLGTGTLSTTNGITIAQLSVPWSQLTVGVDTITANYVGDTNFVGSTGSMSENVQDETSTKVVTSLTPSVYGEQVSLTATITPTLPANLSPTGTVTFSIGGTTLGTAIVGTVNGTSTAVLTLSNLPVGANQTIVANYSGDSSFIGSTGTVSQTVSKTSTRTVLGSTATTIEKGQTVVFTAQVFSVAPGGGVPTGTVTFKDDTTVLATVVLNNGVASYQRALGVVGANSITAIYTGDTNDLASTSAPTVVTVVGLGTRASKVTVASSADPSVVGQAVTFTATVRDAGGVYTPTGTVAFFDGGALLGYGTLSGSGTGVSKATFTTTTLPQGSNSITVAYDGNGLFAHAGSTAIIQTVNAVPIRPSEITLTASSQTTTYGIPVVFTATVTDEGTGAAQTPTGAVTFTANNLSTGAFYNMGNGTLSGANGIATASLSFATLPVGTYQINATYNGDGSFYQEGNLTAPVSHTVTVGSSAVTLTSSLPSGSVFGQAVTFTATVSIPGSNAAPTGTVTFLNQTTGVTYGTFPVNASGVATLKTAALIAGDDVIVATYNGSANSGVSSASVDQFVSQDATKTALSSTSTSGVPVTMTATVTATAPGGGTPTGVVSFYIDGLLVGTGNVNSGGQATFVYTPGVSTGYHTIEASYGGDNNFTGSSISETIDFVVGRGT